MLVGLTRLSDLREARWASCPPDVRTSPPTFQSCILPPHLHYNLPAPISGVVMCNVGWDVFPCLGRSPEPTCISLLNEAFFVCVCVCVLLAQLDDILMSSVISGNNVVVGI